MSGIYTLEDLYINSEDLYMIQEEGDAPESLYACPQKYSVNNVVEGVVKSAIAVMVADNNNCTTNDNMERYSIMQKSYVDIKSATLGSFWDISTQGCENQKRIEKY